MWLCISGRWEWGFDPGGATGALRLGNLGWGLNPALGEGTRATAMGQGWTGEEKELHSSSVVVFL